ncbi:MAG: hypothetical protein V1807_03030 [Patescibacteria group bacterium]
MDASIIAPSVSLDLIKLDLKRFGYYLIVRRRKQRDPLQPMTPRRDWTTTYEIYYRATRKQAVKFSTKEGLTKWIEGGCSLVPICEEE